MEQKIKKNIEIAKKMGMPEDKARELANNTIHTIKNNPIVKKHKNNYLAKKYINEK